jgi:hypothetical protein
LGGGSNCEFIIFCDCVTNYSNKKSHWHFFSLSFHADMEFLEVLTEGLDRVLMVKGCGREVVTIYS